MTVIVVEDDAGMRESIQLLLGVNGYQTRGFASAEAFLADPVAAGACSLLLVDHHLDGRSGAMNGVDLLCRLAGGGRLPPSILVSARLTPAIAAAARSAGARHVLEKPVPPDRLLAFLAESLGRECTTR